MRRDGHLRAQAAAELLQGVRRGTGICEHGRRRSICIECGGTEICEHRRKRSKCKDCGGSEICEHGRQRNCCIECGGKGICKHSKRRSKCKECRGGPARGPLGRCKVQQAPTVSEGTVDEGWDVLSEDEEFRDALAVELFGAEPPEDALAEVDWEDAGWDWQGLTYQKTPRERKALTFRGARATSPPAPGPLNGCNRLRRTKYNYSSHCTSAKRVQYCSSTSRTTTYSPLSTQYTVGGHTAHASRSVSHALQSRLAVCSSGRLPLRSRSRYVRFRRRTASVFDQLSASLASSASSSA